MKFYFNDKNDYEVKIITDVLAENHIPYKIITNHFPLELEEDEKDDEDIVEAYYLVYDVQLDTTLEQFDYMRFLINKRFQQVDKLNKCLKKKVKKKNEINLPQQK